MSEPATSVVCDAGPLIHLDELGCLSLLHDLGCVLVPEQVREEVVRYRPHALTEPYVRFQSVEISISSEPAFQTLAQALSLDAGEQAALSLLHRHPRAFLRPGGVECRHRPQIPCTGPWSLR